MIRQLDHRIRPFLEARNIVVPEKGWINAIRTTMNMTLAQLGARLSISKQGVKGIEDREANGSISLNILHEVATAMDMKLVYCIIPNDDSIDALVERRAEQLARKIVLRTHQNMKLEDQGIGDEKINATIVELSEELKHDLKKSLWD